MSRPTAARSPTTLANVPNELTDELAWDLEALSATESLTNDRLTASKGPVWDRSRRIRLPDTRAGAARPALCGGPSGKYG